MSDIHNDCITGTAGTLNIQKNEKHSITHKSVTTTNRIDLKNSLDVDVLLNNTIFVI
jgi:hypothetical protein